MNVCQRLSLLLVLLATQAEAKGPLLAGLEDIDEPGVRRGMFVLDSSTQLRILAEGVADTDGDVFLSHGWILDLETREPVWTQERAEGEYDKRSENWISDDRITLPAGTYGVYFSAHGGFLPVNERLEILGLTLGRVEMSHGIYRKWDERGDSRDWGIWVHAVDREFEPLPVPRRAPEPYPEAIVRELGLRDRELRRVRIDVERDVSLDLHATGEYYRSGYYVDSSWIVDLSTWERTWTLDRSDTQHAGGAKKNHRFEGRIELEAGSYLLSVATDQTHASGRWNAAPPWDPESWGAALSVVERVDARAIRVERDARLPEPVIEITRVPNQAFRRKAFHVLRDARVLVRATGEQAIGDRRQLVDYGWIERQSDLREIWFMDGALSHPAGGARKNRLVEEGVELAAGSYFLCYVTDDSHAYESWNADPPFEKKSWGITLAELDSDPGDPSVRSGKSEDAVGMIAMAPIGNREHAIKRFETTKPTSVRIIAMGEGDDGEMFDYGWLENSDGEVLWEMDYHDTRRAGGHRKNRETRAVLELPPGVYELHYVSDSSHSFDGWNADPPKQPHLWGLTMLEVQE